jgi:signal transduction histidine kinase
MSLVRAFAGNRMMLCNTVVLALVAHSMIRHRLLDLRIVVDRSLTLAAAVLVSLAPAGVLLALFWPQLSGRLARHEVIIGVVAILSVALLTPPLRDLAGALLDRYVYRGRSNSRRILREASSALSHVLDLDRVTATLIGAVSDVIKAEGVALYLATTDTFSLSASRTAHPGMSFVSPCDMPAAVLGAAAETNVIIVADDVERLVSHEPEKSDLDAALRENDWALVVPLGAQGTLVGILVIGRKLSGDPFSSDDLDAISTLANHAGSAVKNAQLFAESALAKVYIENIVTTIPSGVVAVSGDGRIVLFNPAAEQLTGILQPDAQGAVIETLPPGLCAALRATLVSPERRTYPQISVSSTDPTRMAICTTAPLRDHAAHPAGAVAVFSDLSPVRELERERSRAERLSGFQVLTQALAHEIANPISPIKTMTRLLEQRSGDRMFIQEFQRIVTRELNRIERLITRLRAVGRPQRPVMAQVDLRKAVVAAIEVLTATAGERGIALVCEATSSEIKIAGDPEEFEEMFLNLIKNAIEAIPEGDTRDARVCVDFATSEHHAVVRVIDSGSGFPPELIDQIFVPFVSTKPRGSGLGLAICASVVQRAGGQIDVANRQDGGGVVTIRLPLP